MKLRKRFLVASLFLLYLTVTNSFAANGAGSFQVVVHCECLDDPTEGSILVLVGLNGTSGVETFRKRIDAFGKGDAGKSTCSSRLASAMYCVH